MFKSEYDESDEIEAEKTLAEKMKKAKTKRPKPAIVLDDLQGSYEWNVATIASAVAALVVRELQWL